MTKATNQSLNEPVCSTVADEEARIANRRHGLERIAISNEGPGSLRGLALSGGGIRSATFSLGVMQALAAHQPAAPTTREGGTERSWLAEFDYLSTVSGGGYIGAFFLSLFAPSRLREPARADKTPEQNAALDAYEVLRQNPPGRIRSSDDYSQAPARLKAPLSWLREGGRYLTPTNGGDYVYAAATAVRNWVALHYVIATVLLSTFCLIAVARSEIFYAASTASTTSWVFCLQMSWLPGGQIWWSPLVLFVVPVAVVWLLPAGVAFFLTHPDRGKDAAQEPRVACTAAVTTLALALVGLAVSAGHLESTEPRCAVSLNAERVVAIASGIALLGFVFHVATAWAPSISKQRVLLTRCLAMGLEVLAAVLMLALIDTVGQTLYLLSIGNLRVAALSTAPAIAAIVSLFRYVARRTGTGIPPKWLSALPLGVLAGVAGAFLFVLVAGLESLFVEWLVWQGHVPTVAARPTEPMILLYWFLGLLVLTIVSGRFSGFLNLSTLMSFYGARLTRAYLGASNGRRFDPGGQNTRSVAEPIEGDLLSRKDYYENELAPVHIVNVTVNQTIDPAEQLVQRDRKGTPLALLPRGFTIDTSFYRFKEAPQRFFALDQGTEDLSMGQWIAASGAALTTGLGRATTLGSSLALGLANVRLGYWWRSGYGKDRLSRRAQVVKAIFKTQTYLVYELMASFHGLHRDWQYLSDGGHFENTGLYELLRPERHLRLIVASDCGCDPDYRFNDLANLIRLVRIDFGVRVEVDANVAREDPDSTMHRVFGVPSDFAELDEKSDKCAVLLNVFHAGSNGAVPDCRVILLKPRVIASATADVHEYKATNGEFPQQSTADQFFDEAQWESYRALGFTIGELVFGAVLATELDRYLSSAR